MSTRIYNEELVIKMIKNQMNHHQDFILDVPWEKGINFDLLLLPLDEKAIVFPGASQEQRLAISHMMGLLFSFCVFEMEECLIRLKNQCWGEVYRNFPVNPEFIQLGDLFFEEELRHSQAFKRYAAKYAETAGIDFETLQGIFPRIENSLTEKILLKNIKSGGHTFWWVVAAVEELFLDCYHQIKPHEKLIDPIYFDIQEKHFEEEARHASFPYFVIQVICARNQSLRNQFHTKADLAVAQVMQSLWAIGSLQRMRKGIKSIAKVHPLFDTMNKSLHLLDDQPIYKVLYTLITSAPYVSTLLNTNKHQRVINQAHKHGAIILPFPLPSPRKLVAY